ncbi:MAG: hypothetical protein ACI4DK_14725 [Lachnospiraceae bacterium]
MKTFEAPVVDVKKFDVMDILTTSGADLCPDYVDCPGELPMD